MMLLGACRCCRTVWHLCMAPRVCPPAPVILSRAYTHQSFASNSDKPELDGVVQTAKLGEPWRHTAMVPFPWKGTYEIKISRFVGNGPWAMIVATPSVVGWGGHRLEVEEKICNDRATADAETGSICTCQAGYAGDGTTSCDLCAAGSVSLFVGGYDMPH